MMLSRTYRLLFLWLAFVWIRQPATAQAFYFGADLSYVNEMEDCGVVYKENQAPKDPYQIFAGRQCNLVRLRLWHTPSWYDGLNSGKRYSDLADVRKSIARAHTAGMSVLLDFHLSDNWADPGKQRVPAAWLPVVDSLPLLQDSLRQYITGTLLGLAADNLLPELVQIGNETNKGILLSPQDDMNGWVLDWNRNSALFNTAIQAVRAVENQTGKTIKIALHIAGPANADWLIKGFYDHGVTDFDIIGMSYYWQWHQPTTIPNTGDIIASLRQKYPDKQVMILETGYIWTTASNDAASNTMSSSNPAYQPVNPQNQRKWLVDLTQEVINRGGSGVIDWEPAWVSSPCWTQWGKGSHQENAAFFDFGNNLMEEGGIGFMTYPYSNLTDAQTPNSFRYLHVRPELESQSLIIECAPVDPDKSIHIEVADSAGRLIADKILSRPGQTDVHAQIQMPGKSTGIFIVSVWQEGGPTGHLKIWYP